MENKNNPLGIIYLIFIPMHLGALSIPFLSSWSIINFLYFLVGYVLICGLGTNVGLHRWASHKSIELGKISKYVVTYFSIMACQGHPIWWAAIHRGLHHKHADTDKDIHSPIHGRWNSFFGWILYHNPMNVNYKYAVDLMRNQMLVKTSKYYELIIILSWVIFGFIDLDLLLWMFLLPAVLALHLEGLVNLFCHSDYGYKNFNIDNNSRNIPILGILNWGNGWHNNHHYKPNSFDFGSAVSGKWYEIDFCRIFKPFLKF